MNPYLSAREDIFSYIEHNYTENSGNVYDILTFKQYFHRQFDQYDFLHNQFTTLESIDQTREALKAHILKATSELNIDNYMPVINAMFTQQDTELYALTTKMLEKWFEYIQLLMGDSDSDSD